ncbi:hypothetical protein EVAR_78537_1 [Eumeta japonica]|uniref:Uncharacterized protein n=1 Tax=Eumeta variegata TaxID=151549 RepID=A0A4C1W9L6_EUMVA|nr:hypothetical protein EVAR_78537_1 [Eumeta japonica]
MSSESLKSMNALTRQDVLSEQEFLKAPPSLPCCTPRTQTIYGDRRHLTSNSALFADDTALFYGSRNRGAPDSPSSSSGGPLTS